jgi:hypothetical protein
MDRKRIAVNSTATDSDEVLRREAEILGRYLVKRPLDEPAVSLYVNAVRNTAGVLNERERKRLAFVRRHPWALGLVDAGLNLVDSPAEVRHRIYLMFSILEASPGYHDRFLPVRRRWWFSIAVGATLIAAVARTIVGAIVVKAIVE